MSHYLVGDKAYEIYEVDEELLVRHETLERGDIGRKYIVVSGAIIFIEQGEKQ